MSSTLLDAQGTVHSMLLPDGPWGRTMCVPTGLDDEHLVRCGLDVDCPSCLAVMRSLDSITGIRYEVRLNGSVFGGGTDFRSALASAMRLSLRQPLRLFRLHDDLDDSLVLLEVRGGESVMVTDVTNG